MKFQWKWMAAHKIVYALYGQMNVGTGGWVHLVDQKRVGRKRRNWPIDYCCLIHANQLSISTFHKTSESGQTFAFAIARFLWAKSLFPGIFSLFTVTSQSFKSNMIFLVSFDCYWSTLENDIKFFIFYWFMTKLWPKQVWP